jgi:dienelactone hydrolase
MSVMMVDESREESYSEELGSPRRFMVQIWYPTEPTLSGKTTPWIDHVEVMAPAIADLLGLPSFSLNHLKYVFSHAHQDAPLPKNMNQYPILLFSHGWSGFRAQNTFQVEELVSHGYVVAAPDHSYGAVASVFPDGEVIFLNPEALPFQGSLPEEERLEAVRVLGDQWSHDLSFILDNLLYPDSESDFIKFTGRLDSDKVGAFGHSTGGGAAIQFCASDPRCDGVLGMDPYMEPVDSVVLEEGLNVPVLAMFSESWHNTRRENQENFNQLKQNSIDYKGEFYIEETAHYDFSDLPGLSPLAHTFGLKGKIAGNRVVEIINHYTLAFFEKIFMDADSQFLDGPNSQYPEVIWDQ